MSGPMPPPVAPVVPPGSLENRSGAGPRGGVEIMRGLLGGPWDLVTTYNWDYNPTCNWGNPYLGGL